MRRRRAVLLNNGPRRAEQSESTVTGKPNKAHLEINKMRTYGSHFPGSAESKGQISFRVLCVPPHPPPHRVEEL